MTIKVKYTGKYNHILFYGFRFENGVETEIPADMKQILPADFEITDDGNKKSNTRKSNKPNAKDTGKESDSTDG